MTFLAAARNWARAIKHDVMALWIAARDPRTPWYAKALAGAVAAYALSPIDLIPDFVPVLGYVDDVIIVPLGIMMVVRMVPAELMAEFRLKASTEARRTSLGGLLITGVIWFGLLVVASVWFGHHIAEWTSGAPPA